MKKSIILIFSLITSVIFSQELWNGINYGISEKKIREKLDYVSLPTIKEKEKYGKDIILKLPNYVISEDKYNILFYSKNDQLYQIIVRPSDEELDTRNINIRYDKILYLLRKKYGKESSVVEDKKTSSSIAKHSWIVGPIKIELFRMYYISGLKGFSDITDLYIMYSKYLVEGDYNKL